MNIDGVFSGGGVKALAFIGALDVIEKRGITFERVAGTSAGSIIASLLSAGYDAKELKKIFMPLDFTMFMEEPKWSKSIPILKWILLYFQLGLYKGDKIEKWIDEKLRRKGIRTFGDVPYDYLKIVATDVSLNRMVVFPDDIERFYKMDWRTFPIAKAVRISSTIPFFFVPIKLRNSIQKKSILVDGGLLSNFPIWLFTEEDNKKLRPILGLQLSSTYEELEEKEINGAIGFYQSLFTTMMKAHDARHIREASPKEVMFIPIKEIEATDFQLSTKDKEGLIEAGKESAEKFLSKWSY